MENQNKQDEQTRHRGFMLIKTLNSRHSTTAVEMKEMQEIVALGRRVGGGGGSGEPVA
jgi:hypothetical protein